MWLDIKSLVGFFPQMFSEGKIVFFHKCFRKASWSWFVDGHKPGTEQIERRRGYNFTILLFWPTLLSPNMITS